MNEPIALILNFLLYTFFFLYIKKKKFPSFNELSFIILLWMISSATTIGYYFSSAYYITSNNISFLGLLYIFICFALSITPFYRSNSSTIKCIKDPNHKFFLFFILLCSLTSYIPVIETIIHLIKGGAISDSSALADIHQSDKTYLYDATSYLDWIGKKLHRIQILFLYLSPILLFEYIRIAKGKINYIILIGLVFSTFYSPLFRLAQGARFSLVQIVCFIVFLYFLYKPFLTAKIKKILFYFGVTILTFLFIIFVGITIYRFGDSSAFADRGVSFEGLIFRYAGESFANFSGDMFWADHFTNGYSSFYTLLSDVFGSFKDRHEIIETTTGYRPHVFYTVFGDFYTDFGFIGTFILLFLILFYLKKIAQRNGIISFANIIVISLWALCLINGMFYFCYINDFYSFIFAITVAFIFKLTTK